MAITSNVVGEVTQLLSRWNARDPKDHEKLFELLHPELRRIAELRMRRERRDHTLQATALVNEFVTQLYSHSQMVLKDKSHLLAIASQAMRRILVDYARAHNSGKRSGHLIKVELATIKEPVTGQFSDVLEIDELLTQLAAEEPRMASIVELRYFGGLSNTEVAGILHITERTVKRDWQVARAWLYAHLHGGTGPCSPTNGTT